MTDDSLTRRSPRDRRVEGNRRKLELVLDSFFRPRNWAATVARALGLQGRLRVATSHFEIRQPCTRSSPDGVVASSSESRAPLRIAFASDFHAGATTNPGLLADACAALADLRPDVLLLGGDFVSVRAAYMDRLAPLLAGIAAPFGKFAVLGNHDLRADHRRVVEQLERADVRMITNRHVTLGPPFEDITVCGLDDPTRGDPRADLALDSAQGTRIVLMHSPEGLHAIGDRHFDLALAGHTHGGQIALPGGTPLLVPGGQLNRRYCSGRFSMGEAPPRWLLVSRGVGCSTIPVRLFAPPEIHLCLVG